MIEVLVAFAFVVFIVTAVLRIWWTLATWELRRKKLRLETERAELRKEKTRARG